jgi:hypothetical protein
MQGSWWAGGARRGAWSGGGGCRVIFPPNRTHDLCDIDRPTKSNHNLANQNWNKIPGRPPAGGRGLILGDRQVGPQVQRGFFTMKKVTRRACFLACWQGFPRAFQADWRKNGARQHQLHRCMHACRGQTADVPFFLSMCSDPAACVPIRRMPVVVTDRRSPIIACKAEII